MDGFFRTHMNTVLRALRRVRRTVFPYSNPYVNRMVECIKARWRLSYVDDVQGHRMYLDPKDSLDLSVGRVHEPAKTALLDRLVGEGSVALDIGANIGYYTLLLARRVGDRGHVYAFEPERQNFALLAKNVGINGYRNVTLINRAVSDRTGTEALFLGKDNLGDHRIYDSHDGRDAVRVESVRLDGYFAGFDREIALVKMDIQGAEYRAVKGMESLLTRNPAVVLVTEFWPGGLARSGIEPQAYLDLLSGLGFASFVEIDEGKGTVRGIDPADLLAVRSWEDEDHTDLICARHPETASLLVT